MHLLETSRRLVGLILVLASCLPSARAGVVVVDAAGGGDFLDLPEAVAAAADGDAILVQPAAAAYSGFVIDGKSLDVLSAVSNIVVTVRASEVRHVPAGGAVVLRLLAFQPQGLEEKQPGLRLSQCLGSVRLEACQVTGATGFTTTATKGSPGLSVYRCRDVGLAECTLRGGPSASVLQLGPSDDAGSGLLADLSTVWMHGGSSEGGAALGAGGHGVQLAGSSEVLLAGGVARGGAGKIGGNGFVLPAGALGHVRAATIVAGSGTQQPGVPVEVSGGTLDEVPLVPRSLKSISPLHAGDVLTLTVLGQQGDVAWLLASLAPSAMQAAGGWHPGLAGPLLVGNLAVPPIPLGSVGASGKLASSFPFPDFGLGPGNGPWHVDLFLQLAVGSSAGVSLEAGTTVTFLPVGP